MDAQIYTLSMNTILSMTTIAGQNIRYFLVRVTQKVHGFDFVQLAVIHGGGQTSERSISQADQKPVFQLRCFAQSPAGVHDPSGTAEAALFE